MLLYFRRIETQYIDKLNSNLSYTRKMIYDNEDIILELDANNKPVVFYVHGAGIDEPIAMIRDIDGDNIFESNEVFYYTKDNLNSVRELLDNQGNIYQRYTYSAYGETKIAKHNRNSKLIENRYAYTSRELDSHTGLYYYRARWYTPEQGQFLSPDPIKFRGRDFNLYRYVGSNPLLTGDPSGQIAPVIAVGAIVVGGAVGGIVAAVTTFAQGGSASDAGEAAIVGAVGGAVSAMGIGAGVVASAGAIVLGAGAAAITAATVVNLGNSVNFPTAPSSPLNPGANPPSGSNSSPSNGGSASPTGNSCGGR